MFGTRRLAKRSIIGTRVSAPLQDGRFCPGVIQSTQTGPNGDELYSVIFDDGYSAIFNETNIVGPGFQNITSLHLVPKQQVFITYNGRECAGSVVHHNLATDELDIQVHIPDGHDFEIVRKQDDVRLFESRRSARLQDQDTDYSRMLDMHPEPKKRTVSSVIDVPGPAPKQSRRRRMSPTEEDMMEDDDDDDNGSPVNVMDERAAAMVLTSLSVSPASPTIPSGFSFRERGEGKMSGSSINSSGVFTFKSESSTPSPPQPVAVGPRPAPMFDSQNVDEGIEIDPGLDQDDSPKQTVMVSTRTVFKCTWPGCNKVHLSVPAIENHVRNEHLGPKKNDEDDEFSDHEEEFYYTEEEISIENMTQTFADMYTSSPPQVTHMEAARSLIQDHDYQKKAHRTSPQNIPKTVSSNSPISSGNTSHVAVSFPTQLEVPFAIPPFSSSFSWQHDYSSPSASFPGTSQVRPSKAQERLHQHQMHSPKINVSSSPKTSASHKKLRSEIKKCRKVYGMENRDMWCTQCKWKKACTRFMD